MESPWGDAVVAGVYGGHPGLVFEPRPRTFDNSSSPACSAGPDAPFSSRANGGSPPAVLAALGPAWEALASLGIRPGDRVMLLGYNSPDWVLALWSVWSLGAVPVLGNRWWSHPETAHALALTAPRVVIADAAVDLVPKDTPVLEMGSLSACFSAHPP